MTVLIAVIGIVCFGDNYDWHILEIILTEPNLEAFTFTFGKIIIINGSFCSGV